MLLYPLIALFLAPVALTSPLSPSTGLSITLGVAQPEVASAEEIVLTATVTNSGSKGVRFVKYGTVLDDLPTQSFSVKSKDGSEVPFIGVQVQLDVEQLALEGYSTIPPGHSVSVTHKVFGLYDFESAGVGSFVFTPVAHFFMVDTVDNATATPLYFNAKVDTNSVEVRVTESVKGPNHEPDKRATVSCPDAAKAKFIADSYKEAKELADLAKNWIPKNPTSALFKSYFKTNTPAWTAQRFTNVHSENLFLMQLRCTDEAGICKPGVAAYTLLNSPKKIVFCPPFFTQVPTTRLCNGVTVDSRRIRGGTVLHELTHAVLITKEYTADCPGSIKLGWFEQLRNAANYNCFATQLYKNTKC